MEDKRLKKIISSAKITDRIMTAVISSGGIFFLLLLISLCAYILINGAVSFSPEFLRFDSQGIGNQFFNTVYLVFLSLLISCPIGIFAGVYLSVYATDGKIVSFVSVAIESLSSLPSIVVGLFGYSVFILMTGAKWNLMAGALAVSILSIPGITVTTKDAISSLPKDLKSGSMALGATKAETIRKVLLPACLPRIFTGIILAAGRGFGEAAALLYTAGQSTSIDWTNFDITSPRCPFNPFRPGETLALHIWVLRTEGSLHANSAAMANFSAAVLVLMVLGFSLLSRHLSKKLDRKGGGL